LSISDRLNMIPIVMVRSLPELMDASRLQRVQNRMDLLLDVASFLIYAVGSILLAGSIFYLITVWNVRRPKLEYTFFPRVSLMAYAWQSGNVIERKINNFLEQDYPRDRFEVIIYDNDSTDETRDICLRYEKLGLIKHYGPPRAYDRKGPVLDQAIGEVATGEIIALTDPDGVCERDWVKKIVQPFKDSKVGAVSGITHCGNYYVNLFTKFRAIEDEWWYNISVLGKSGKVRISSFEPLCGANYALRRAAWESVGRTHGKSLVEDYEMTLRLYGKGWKIACADANVWQEEVDDVGEYIRQRRRWYQSPIQKLVEGKGKIDKALGALPISMQATAFLSLLYLVIVCGYQAIRWGLTFFSLIFAVPLLLTYCALALGLIKVGKASLLRYVPLFLAFDSALQLIIVAETKLRFREERHWVQLAKGEYYHSGATIRTA
jgi:cellulose synthase/poly-beta-1,6-N-acetylglucosamine synthase-like glycosyltransferase